MPDFNCIFNRIKKIIDEKGYNVYDFAVYKDGEVCFEKMQYCAPYHSGYSVTKLFINTEIGVMFDKGLLSLDDKATDILRGEIKYDYDKRWDQVSVFDLLTHKTGLDTSIIDIDRGDTHEYGTDDYLKLIMLNGPEKETGEFYCYTDVPHYLLSRIINVLTGSFADDALRRDVFSKMNFRPAAFIKCPQGHPIGSSGSFIYADDMAKLAHVYMNGGVFEGRQIVSEKWTELAKENEFDFFRLWDSSFYGKGGMHGQMAMSDGRVSAAWHAYVENSEQIERDFIEALT